MGTVTISEHLGESSRRDSDRRRYSGRPIDIGRLKKEIALRYSLILMILGLAFFIPAGTFAYWQAWVFLAVIAIPAAGVLLYFLQRDPELLERRMRVKEKEPAQKKIMKVSFVVSALSFLIPGFDRRFDWSSVPVAVVIASDCIVLLGYWIFTVVLKVNRYTSRIIEVEPGQKVVTTGPYAVVRHPMYVGALLINVFAPLALGSYWALIPSVASIAVVVARIKNEEQVLSKELAGYAEYTRTTTYRLLPGIW